MKISVIVPIYNVGRYLERCVDSILAQTYTDLEVILVDDGSPDNSAEICDRYSESDERVCVIHKENGGVSSALNAGIDKASGEVITFVDGDDSVDPDMYRSLMSLMLEHNADIVECSYRYFHYDRENEEDKDTDKVYVLNADEAIEKMFFSDRLNDGTTVEKINKLYRRELFDGERFPVGINYAEDYALIPRLMARCERYVKYDKTFYTYFQNEGSATRSPYSIKKADQEIYANRSLMVFFGEIGMDKYRDYLTVRTMHVLRHHFFECFSRRKDKEYLERARGLKKEINELYPKMKNNPYRSSLWKYTLFEVSPRLWYIAASLMGENRKNK